MAQIITTLKKLAFWMLFFFIIQTVFVFVGLLSAFIKMDHNLLVNLVNLITLIFLLLAYLPLRKYNSSLNKQDMEDFSGKFKLYLIMWFSGIILTILLVIFGSIFFARKSQELQMEQYQKMQQQNSEYNYQSYDTTFIENP